MPDMGSTLRELLSALNIFICIHIYRVYELSILEVGMIIEIDSLSILYEYHELNRLSPNLYRV